MFARPPARITALAVSFGLAACAAARPGADGGAVAIAPAPRVRSAGRMKLRPIADGRLLATEHGAYLFGCHPITVSRVDRGATTPMPAFEKALVGASVACVDAVAEPTPGRLLVSALLAEGEAAWLGWSGAATEQAPPHAAPPARLVVPVGESGEVSEATLRGEIAVEPASRYPRAPNPVTRLRGQLTLPGGALVVIGHLDDGALAAEVWSAPGERGRAEALPAAPPWTNWDPSLAPRAARAASAGAGHACVVPTSIAETPSHRYLACYDGGSWSEVDTSSLGGVIASLGGGEGWVWATTTMTAAPGVFRMPIGGRWERVGTLPEDALETRVAVRSAREVYVSAGESNWVALEGP